MRQLLRAIRNWHRRRVYKPGHVVSRFIASDVRREIKVLSVDQIDDGIIIAQERTNNVLYLSHGLTEEVGFSEPKILRIHSMWKWSGEPRGGLPEGTSIAHRVEENGAD